MAKWLSAAPKRENGTESEERTIRKFSWRSILHFGSCLQSQQVIRAKAEASTEFCWFLAEHVSCSLQVQMSSLRIRILFQRLCWRWVGSHNLQCNVAVSNLLNKFYIYEVWGICCAQTSRTCTHKFCLFWFAEADFHYSSGGKYDLINSHTTTLMHDPLLESGLPFSLWCMLLKHALMQIDVRSHAKA